MKLSLHYMTILACRPENVPRLFDLVRIQDTRFQTAFYFALRNTLVAKDLDQATRIGLQGRSRHRVVTLGGQLVDVSGTYTGVHLEKSPRGAKARWKTFWGGGGGAYSEQYSIFEGLKSQGGRMTPAPLPP